MKDKYLNEIKAKLSRYQMDKAELEDILNDYSQMYDDGLDRGLTNQEVIEFLGSPEKVVSDLADSFKKITQPVRGRKLIALMPFISVIIFFISGFVYDLWNPAWLVFLLIPMTAILVDGANKKSRHTLTALSPFLATIIFILSGTIFKTWHPIWLIYFIIPVSAIITSSKEQSLLSTITALTPFIAIVTFFFLGTLFQLWNPGWLVFLIIPMVGILNEKNSVKAFWFEVCFIVAIVIYLYVGYAYSLWGYALFAFLIPILYGIFTGNLVISITGGRLDDALVLLFCVVLYVAFGIIFTTWASLWVIFFFVPIYAIFRYGTKKDWVVAISPFVATTIFYLLGYFFGLWYISWLAFLLIPIAGILRK